ncbi:MAG: copper chaperone [Actinomycetota bacterium]|nr:MAG: copper chaperone [Actinomycetota bacterium]
MRNVELSAKDISCNHCKMTIENGISGSVGVTSVQVDIDTKKVDVIFDESKITVDTLLGQLLELGYPAEVTVG